MKQLVKLFYSPVLHKAVNTRVKIIIIIKKKGSQGRFEQKHCKGEQPEEVIRGNDAQKKRKELNT